MAKKMRAGGGREKGAEFEKLICQKLSLWVSDLTRKDLFWRSPGSGSRATVVGVDASNHAGDIIATHEDSSQFLDWFYVECKFYKDLLMEAFVFGTAGHSSVIWEKPVEEASQHGRLPFVVVKQNRKGELILINSPGLALLQTGYSPIETVHGQPRLSVTAHFPEQDLWVLHLKDFLCDVSYSMLKQKNAKQKRVRRKPPPE